MSNIERKMELAKEAVELIKEFGEEASIVGDNPIKSIEIKENGETINAYEYQDFSVDNFLFIPRGTVTLEFKPNVSQPPKCVITMMEGYLSN